MQDLLDLHKTNFGGSIWICDLCAKRLEIEGNKIREEILKEARDKDAD